MHANLGLSIVVIIILLLLFFVFGSLITYRSEKGGNTILYTVNIGFMVYFTVFQIIALPMKLLLQPLSRLAIIWVVICFGVSILSVVINMKPWKCHFRSDDFRNTIPHTMVVLVILIGLICLITNNIQYGSTIDSAYYIGISGSSVFTDTIEQYNPYTGVKMDTLDSLYLLLTYSVHNSVVSMITKIHPLIVYRLIMSTIVIIITGFNLYNIAAEFLSKHKIRLLATWILMLAVYMCGYSMYSPSGFFTYRTFEGKTILAVIVIPTLLLILIRTLRKKHNFWEWCEMLCVLIGGMAFSMSAMLLMPTLISMYYIPVILSKSRKKVIWKYIISMLICAGLIGVHLCISKGIIQIKIM